MKFNTLLKCTAIFTLCLSINLVYGQTENVGIGTITPDPSAILDVVSPETSPKGILIPRMGPIELANMEALYNDTLPGGLLIYEEEAGEFWYYKRFDPLPIVPPLGEWVALSTTTTSANAFPTGGIIQWAGTIASIPTGWSLCDGSNGTPDLTDKFILSVANSAEDPVITNQAVEVVNSVVFPDRRIYKLAYIQKL